jgi:anti-sigma regulatory factor (Ser/Thr protein kinase)
MVENNSLELTLDATEENLEAIANFIVTSMKKLGISSSIYEVQTAVDEACTNIVKYAYHGSKGTISLSCNLRDKDFTVVIRDRGKPFDPTSVPLPDVSSGVEERKIGGLGIYLMRKLMDEVSYDFDASLGNTLTMKKRVTTI